MSVVRWDTMGVYVVSILFMCLWWRGGPIVQISRKIEPKN